MSIMSIISCPCLLACQSSFLPRTVPSQHKHPRICKDVRQPRPQPLLYQQRKHTPHRPLNRPPFLLSSQFWPFAFWLLLFPCPC
jgi:hypothetical protein